MKLDVHVFAGIKILRMLALIGKNDFEEHGLGL